MVKGYGDPVDVVGKEHVAVEGAPVELLFEILPEAALTGTSMLKPSTGNSVFRILSISKSLSR